MTINDEIIFVVDGKVGDKPAKPNTLPLKDIAYVLEKFATAVQAIAEAKDHLAGPIEIHLVGISEGSGRYQLDTDKRGHRHAGTIIDALERQDGSELPHRARKAIESIHGRTKKRGWDFGIESRGASGSFRKVTVEPKRRLFDQQLAHGRTTVVAEVIKAGGEAGSCSVQLKLTSGQLLNAKVASKQLTEALGSLLYKRIELIGQAKWNIETLQLVGFTVLAIGEYTANSADPAEALELLSQLSGGSWENIDVNSYVAEVRESESGN